MDTKVSLLDGRELSISQIEQELNLGKQLWTYSCDEYTGEVKPGLISWAGVTQSSAKVLRLTLDNGEEIICTPDHKFPVYGKGFVEAKDFVEGQSLIPVNQQQELPWIIKIEYLDDEIEVGTLTIDVDEIYHNHHTFALSCGVFTKNSNLGSIEDIQYFQNKLYQALNVPISRLLPQQNFSLGRTTEITREEVKFNKFIERLRKKFSCLLRDALRVQLITKGIIRPEEWDDMAYNIRIDYQRDNYFSEMKESEIINNRIGALQNIDPFVGKYYSTNWVRKNVLMQTEKEIKTMDGEIESDRELQLDQASHEGELDAAKQQPTLDQQKTQQGEDK